MSLNNIRSHNMVYLDSYNHLSCCMQHEPSLVIDWWLLMAKLQLLKVQLLKVQSLAKFEAKERFNHILIKLCIYIGSIRSFTIKRQT